MKNLYVLAIFLGVSCSAMATSSTPPPEEYIEIFKHRLPHEQVKAAERLVSEGFSSSLIFDEVESNVNKYLPISDQDSVVYYFVSQVRALGYSGNKKYKQTLLRVLKEAKKRGVSKHAKKALQDLDEFADLNKIISPTQWPDAPTLSVEQRLLNMVRSNSSKLQMMAAMQLYHSRRFDEKTLGASVESIKNNYQRDLRHDEIDAIAWLCKFVASTKSLEYKDIIHLVAMNAKNKKLRNYAKSYLKNYYE